MKQLTIIFLLVFTAGLWGQEAKEAAYPKAYPQGFIGIHTRFGAASVYSSVIGQSYAIPINTILLEIVPHGRDKRGSAFMLSFRITQPFTAAPASLNRDMSRNYPFERLSYRPMFNILYWGFLVGGSTQLYVQNKATGLGWSVLLNGGIFTDVPNLTDPENSSDAAFNLGAETDLKAVYRFGLYSAFSMGINMGYTWRIGNVRGGDHAFVHGFNIGFIF